MMDIKTDVMQKLKCFNMPTDNHDQLQQMAMYLFGQMGPNSIVEQSLFVIWGCNTFIGNNVRIGEG